MDLQKAFNKVSSGCLLKKLAGYEVGGKVLEWITLFLIGR